MKRTTKRLFYIAFLVGFVLSGCSATSFVGLAGPASEVTIQDGFRWMRQNHDERYENRALQWELVKEKVLELRKERKYEEAITTLQRHYPKLVTEQAIRKLSESDKN